MLHVLPVKPSDSTEDIFDIIVNDIQIHGKKAERLIFCKNCDDCGRIYAMTKRKLAGDFLDMMGNLLWNNFFVTHETQ